MRSFFLVCLSAFLFACSNHAGVSPAPDLMIAHDMAQSTVDMSPQPVKACLLGDVWGESSSDVYVGGSDCASHAIVLHSTGDGNWTTQSAPGAVIGALWGSGSGDVYAATSVTQTSGTIVHSTGDGTWTMQPSFGADIARIWGSSAGDIYAVGNDGAILHSTGNGAWEQQNSGTTVTLLGLWGSSASDIYAVGGEVGDSRDGVILHSTGDGTWQLQSLPPTPVGDPAQQVFDYGVAVWGSGSNDVYAVFNDSAGAGRILHSVGDGTWTLEYTASFEIGLWSVWGRDSGDVYVAGDKIIHSTGNGTWTLETAPNDSFDEIWGTTGGLYAVSPMKIDYLVGF